MCVPSCASSDIGLGLGSDEVDLARNGLGSLGVITGDLGCVADQYESEGSNRRDSP